MDTHAGGCHCGAVRFEVDADLASERIQDCNCSVCKKKGFLHLIVPHERFRLLAGKESLTTYTFGTHAAKHTFCKHCGMHSFYTPRSHPHGIDVNARCLDAVDLARLSIEAFDGENWEAAAALLPTI